MAKETHIRQHYVPQSYLRRFADGHERIFVFDKRTGIEREDKISNVGAAKQFYTYPAEGFKESKTKTELKALEFAFSEAVEPEFQAVVTETLAYAEGKILPDQLHEPLVQHLTIQLLRTQSYRQGIKQMMDNAAKVRARRVMKSCGRHIDEGFIARVRAHDHNVVGMHLGMVLDPELITAYMDELMNYIWLVAETPGPSVFYTSDTPRLKVRIRQNRARSSFRLALGFR